MAEFRTLVVPHDFSAHAEAALAAALDLAQHFDSDIHLLHVVQPPSYGYSADGFGSVPALFEVKDGSMKALTAIADQIEDPPGRVEAHVVDGVNIAASIDRVAADLGADLIVMGTHGRTGLAHVFLGSVAERTLRRAPCPVLTVRGVESEESEQPSHF